MRDSGEPQKAVFKHLRPLSHIPIDSNIDHLIGIDTDIRPLYESHLIIDQQRADHQQDGYGKLENNEYIPEENSFFIRCFPFQHADGLERREDESGIYSGEET